jgi:hypothetical protein
MAGAVRYALASAAHNLPSTWNGGATIPSAGDTVYLNSFTVTGYAADFDLTTGAPDVNAPSLVAGVFYVIKTVGSTTWTSIGALDNNIGTGFFATGAGTGSGVATAVGCITNRSLASPAITGGGSFACGDGRTLKATVYGANVTGNAVVYSGYTSTTIVGDIYPSTITGAIGSIRLTGGYGTLIVNGNIKQQQSVLTVGGVGIQSTTSGASLIVNGNIEAPTGAGGNGINSNAAALFNLTINGTITGGTNSATAISGAVSNTVTIMGPLVGSVPTAPVITGGSGGTNAHAVVLQGSGCSATVTIGSASLPGTITGGSSTSGHGVVVQSSATPDVTIWATVTGTAGVGVECSVPCKLTVNGNVTNAGNNLGLNMQGGVMVTVNGNITGSSTAASSGMSAGGNSIITVNGNVTGGAFAGAYGINESGASYCKINGNVYPGSGSGSIGCYLNGNNNVFVVNGTCYASNSTAVSANGLQVYNGTTAYIQKVVGCNYNSSNGISPSFGAIASNAGGAGRIFVRQTQQGTGGYPAVSGNIYRWTDNVGYTDEDSLYTAAGSNYATLKHRFGDSAYVPPTVDKVRLGTAFAFGDMTGTANIPSVNSVRKNQNVDATSGVAYVSAVDIWNLPNTTAPSSDSLLSVISKAATPETAASLTVSFDT